MLPQGGLAVCRQWPRSPYWYVKPQLTFSQDLIVKIPHEVNTLLRGDPHKWLSNSQIIQYQGLLCENPNLHIEPCQGLKLATLLPMGEGGPTHDCKEVLEEVYASCPDLRDRSISNPDWTLYTDSTSLVKLGQRLSSYAVVTETTVIEASTGQPNELSYGP